MTTAARTTLVILFAGIAIGMILGAGILANASYLLKSPPAAIAQQPTANTQQVSAERDLMSIYNDTKGSVVQITSKVSVVNDNIIVNGNPLQSESTRLGSGFFYDSQGTIITNNHVVENTNTVDVTLTDGNTYTAKVLGRDAYSDLAVIKITDKFSEEFKPIKIGSSTDLRVGQQVAAIGNPFGLSNTMTTGIVSQLGRLIPNENNNFSIPDIVQTDAAINPGNSGGPLLNMKGEVIGVNSAIQSNTGSFSGIGFAIPSGALQRIVPALIKDGKYEHPWLGIAGTNLNPEIEAKLGVPKNSKGVLITSVTQGGPAQKAGLQGTTFDALGNIQEIGDVLTAVNGHEVKRIEDVITYFEENTHPGDAATLNITREGSHQIQLHITLGQRPDSIN